MDKEINILMENSQDIQKTRSPQKKSGSLSKIARIGTAAAMFWSQIIGGCTPISQSENNSDGSTNIPPQSEPSPDFNESNVPTTEIVTGKTQEAIGSPPYPKTSDGFILNDPRSKEDIQKEIDDYKKDAAAQYETRVRLYNQKLVEMGEKAENYTTLLSTDPNGDAWALTLIDRINPNNMLIPTTSEGTPHSDLTISPLAPLSSFNLQRISNEKGLRIVWDKSGWPVIVSNDNLEWYSTGNIPIGWQDITQTESQQETKPTKEIVQEKKFAIKADIPTSYVIEELEKQGYTPVTVEDIISGALTKQEEEYLKNNPQFTDQVVTTKSLIAEKGYTAWAGHTIKFSQAMIDFTVPEYKNPLARPVKIFNISPFIDKELYRDLKYEEKYVNNTTVRTFLISQVYKNPDGSEIIEHILVDLDFFIHDQEWCKTNRGKDFQLAPIISYSERKEDNNSDYNPDYSTTLMVDTLWKKYPETSPKDFVDTWIKTGNMSKEMQNKVLGWNVDLLICW